MSTKRDKKRTQRSRRAEQKRHGEVNRQRQRQAEEFQTRLAAVIDAIERMAVDADVTSAVFAAHLEEVLAQEATVAALSSSVAGWDWGDRLAAQTGPERAQALAAALIEQSDPSNGSRWWAAGLYRGANRRDLAEELGSSLLDEDPEDDDLRVLVGRLRLDLGRAADTAEIARVISDDDPHDLSGQELLAASLHLMADRLGSPPDNEVCPCGSGRPWPACCAGREAATLAAFSDRTRLYALGRVVAEFVVSDAALAEWCQAAVAEWLAADGEEDWDFQSLVDPEYADPAGEARYRLALESCWTRGPAWQPGEHADDEDDDSQSILNRFAADESRPEDLRALARVWQESACFGLWQVTDPDPAPGIWLTDIVTGKDVYAALAPEQSTGLARWSVLAGCLVPDRAVWRSGAVLMLLDPDEGDMAAEMADAAVSTVVGELARERHLSGARRLRSRSARLAEAPPRGVLVGILDPIEPPVSQVYHNVVAAALPAFLSEIEARRSHPPRLVNSDKEPIEVLRAAARVDDPQALRTRLLERPDFEADHDDGRIAWRGREMTALEEETSRAQARDFAASQGVGLVEDAGEPHRWIRGFLDLDGNRLAIEVNSRDRLDAITRILRKLGVAEPLVEARLDPTLDLPVPSGWRPLADAGSPEAEAVWRQHWLEEPLPALDGKTPRLAATGDDPKVSLKLEALLRRFEFDADLAAAQGKRPLDVAQLRADLGRDDGVPFGV